MAAVQALVVVAVLVAGAVAAAPKHPNILYLVSDDMRPELGTYGHSFMKTPALDHLAATGTQFDFAYTQFAYCAPSRNSFMSGRRPDRTNCLNFLHKFRDYHPNWIAMPEFFAHHGYFTSAAGKLYHDGMDDAKSWTYPSNQSKWIMCQPDDNLGLYDNYCTVASKKKNYTDEELILHEGLLRMKLAHESGKPWFVGIGLHRPHTEYRVREEFHPDKFYPVDEVKPPKYPLAPIGAPYMSGNWHGGDIKDPAHGCPTCAIPANRSVEYRRWYYSALTYSDYMQGQALAYLDALGVSDNTIVVFHSDHGYQLGELNEWSKKTDTELAVHVPMIIRVPWKQNSIGKRTKARAELVDMYRTLVDLAGLPSDQIEQDVQGTSLAAVFDDPESLPVHLENKPAYSEIGRCACQRYVTSQYNVTECAAGACVRTPVDQFDFIGYTMRVDNYRYTAWVPMNKTSMRGDWNNVAADELYDLTGDDGRDFDFAGYHVNVADQHSDLVKTYRGQLREAVQSWQ